MYAVYITRNLLCISHDLFQTKILSDLRRRVSWLIVVLHQKRVARLNTPEQWF